MKFEPFFWETLAFLLIALMIAAAFYAGLSNDIGAFSKALVYIIRTLQARDPMTGQFLTVQTPTPTQVQPTGKTF